MRTMVPVYYPEFRCIASACRHTCCGGWEIDVDDGSLERYRQYAGPLGNELRRSITTNEEGEAIFRLRPDGRCPMLTDDGLCRIITEMGKDALCEICAMHPRWVNEFSRFTEMGLGLTCEAAARLILREKRKAVMIPLEEGDGDKEDVTADEKDFFEFRDRVLEILWRRDMPMRRRLAALESEGYAIETGEAFEWREILLNLECLDPDWKKAVNSLPSGGTTSPAMDLPLEQAAVYFVMRHLSPAASDGLYRERCGLAVLLTKLLSALSGTGNVEESARMLSTEIEYNADNLADLLIRIQ